MKIFKQIYLLFISQPQSSFLNQQKLKNNEALTSNETLYRSELSYKLLDPLGQF
jgi:hypothetical protein